MFEHFKQHLVYQLGAGVTLFSLLAVTLMSLFTYSTSRDVLRDGIFSQIENVASGLEVSIENWFVERQRDVDSLAVNHVFMEQVKDLLSRGEEIPAARRSYSELRRLLDELVQMNPEFREVLVMSKRAGEVLLSTNQEHEGSFQKDSFFFTEGLRASTVVPVYYWPQTLEPVMTLSFPVSGENGQALGVIAVHIDLRRVLSLMSSFPTVARIGNAYLVDKNFGPVGASAEWSKDFPRGLHSLGIDKAVAREQGTAIYQDFLGQEVVGSYQWLERFGLALVVETPLSAAFEPARDLGWVIFGLGCFGVMVISSGLIVLARRIVRPVLEVSRAAQKVASGNLEVPPLGAARAEIGVLVSSFNDMVRQIHALLDDVRDREERYRTVFNASGEAIFVHAQDSSRVLEYNEAALKMFGLEEGEIIENIVELSAGYPPYSEEDALEKMTAARDKGPQFFEWRSRRKSGELFWSEVLLSKMVVAGELRFLAVVHDIEQRKRTEEELAEYRQNLEWAIEDRTNQLEEAQKSLVKQERLAVLGQLTATVSHELRNPLGTISNALFSLEAALGAGTVEAGQKALALIERNVRRCDKIIGELLDFTRRHESEMQDIVVEEWLDALLEEYTFPPEIEVERDYAGGARVVMDPESMRRALVNLLENAVQAMQERGACGTLLTVATRVVDDNVEIRVTDQGPGISEENRKAIFEPLFSTKEFGVGLGVPIIQNVVEKHLGSLNYFCPPDGGTVAVVTLPLEK